MHIAIRGTILTLILAPILCTAGAQAADLTIRIDNVENNDGQLMVALYDGAAGYLKQPVHKRDRFFRNQPMQTDTRPLKEVVDDFARQMYGLLTSQEAVDMQRIVMAEAPTNPELAEAFWNGGPRQTREMLGRFFARPDIRAQLRPDIDLDLLPGHLMGCIAGDQLCRFVFPPEKQPLDQALRALDRRLDLFYRAVLARP